MKWEYAVILVSELNLHIFLFFLTIGRFCFIIRLHIISAKISFNVQYSTVVGIWALLVSEKKAL